MSPSLSLLAKDLDMNVEFVSAVVITGLVVVFIGLILLIVFVYIMGKVFTFKKKPAKPKALPQQNDGVKKNAITSSPVENAARPAAVNDGIDDEIVAVIAAAVAAIGSASGKKLSVRSIRPAGNQRSPWAAAGLQQNTRPF